MGLESLQPSQVHLEDFGPAVALDLALCEGHQRTVGRRDAVPIARLGAWADLGLEVLDQRRLLLPFALVHRDCAHVRIGVLGAPRLGDMLGLRGSSGMFHVSLEPLQFWRVGRNSKNRMMITCMKTSRASLQRLSDAFVK